MIILSKRINIRKIIVSLFWNAVAVLALVVLLAVLSGCAPENNRQVPFQIVFGSLNMNESAISQFENLLKNEIPELTIGGNAPLFTAMVMGEVQNDAESAIIIDPMFAIGGMMKLPALIAAGELDMMICDMENAARNARGDMFMPLGDIFSDEELAELSGRLLSFDLVESDGYETVATGEKTLVCGINVSDNAALKSIFGNQEIGVFIVANTKNVDLVKTVMLSLI